jgi:hypothetical protein
LFRKGAAAKKTEGAAGVELDIRHTAKTQEQRLRSTLTPALSLREREFFSKRLM